MAVAVETEPSFRAQKPRLLFEGNYGQQYDVAPDGNKFILIKYSEREPVHISLVQNWFEELRTRVSESGD